MENLLTSEQFCKLTGYSRSGLYKLVKNKKIPYIKLNNYTLKFNKEDVINWIKSKKITQDNKMNCDHLLGYYEDEEMIFLYLNHYSVHKYMKDFFTYFKYCPECGRELKDIIKTLDTI